MSEPEGQPLLALVMIVKNEARSIRRTIESVRPFVDRWLVLDTGSTDGTQDIVKDAFGTLPGRLEEEPFVDFGTTRSRALDLLGAETVFSLMLSGDESLQGGQALRKFCDDHKGLSGEGAYYLRVHFGDLVYDSARLARTREGWRYAGVTHEVLVKEGAPAPTLRVPDAHIHHDLRHRSAESQKTRWQLDLRLLTAELEKHPSHARACFYQAQTLECLGEYELARAAYERRAKLGGWHEEVYEALFRMGRVMGLALRGWPETQQCYLDAYAHSPHRAEALFAIAWHYYGCQSWALTYLFAKRGSEIPFPVQSTLFVDADVYRYKLLDLVGVAAYHVTEFESGESALTKAIAALRDDEAAVKERLSNNLLLYRQRRLAQPGDRKPVPTA
jgi:tetratricopeptide (TPR) repeat protein